MLLTSDLAQQIVDSIMHSAQQNINIMDSRGIIIGSGHKHRIDTFHKGAKDAISSGQIVEIHQNELALYPGALPGLNMPIILNEQIIGVVGISGDPDDVRDTAKMVKMVTELILEREILREEFRSQSQLQEHFATLLLSDQASANYDKLSQTAKILQYHLELPRTVLAADVNPILEQAFHDFGLNGLVSVRTKESLLQLLINSPTITAQDLPVFVENKLIILKHFPAGTSEVVQRQWEESLYELLHSNSNQAPLCIGLGSLTQDYTELNQSYQEALFSLQSCTATNPVSAIYDFDTLTAYLIAKIRNTEACQPLDGTKAKLQNGFSRKYDMKNTVVCLLNNHLNITSTAKALFIHRNTLLFRLEKLKEATGLDPCRYLNHAILCKIIFDN